jgi:hypothetical protein
VQLEVQVKKGTSTDSTSLIHKEKEMADFRKSLPVLAVFALMLMSAVSANAQGPAFSCFANAGVPPIVRAEGITELVGDILLNCTGGTPTPAGQPIPAVNIQIFLNTPVTSKLVSGSTLTEALLFLDDPGPQNLGNPTQAPCTLSVCTNVGNGTGAGYYVGQAPGNTNVNVFQAQTVAGNPNSLLWIGVPIDPPGSVGTRIIRITNVRAYAAQFGAGSTVPTAITTLISATGTFSVPINNPVQTVALIQKGLQFTASSATTLQQCFSQSFRLVNTLTYRELFATAFKKYNVGSSDASPTTAVAQNNFSPALNTETGFYNPGFPSTNGLNAAGLPTFGTRLRATFANIPSGVSLFVSRTNTDTGVDRARLTSSETGAFSAVALASGAPADVAQITLTGGAGVAVWEVTESSSTSFAAMTFNVHVSYTANPGAGSPALGTGTVAGTYAPLSTTVAVASSPIPRFVDTGTASNMVTINPCVTNLLFPFVTSQAGFDTGIAISNTSKDPFATSTQAGTCTVNSYGANEVAAITTPTVAAGTSWVGLASSLMPNFQGYLIAQCRFQYAHGFAFVTKVGAVDVAMGYLALVIPDPARSPAPFPCGGGSTIAGCVLSGEQLGQ